MIATDTPTEVALNESLAKWKETVLAELKGVPIEKKLVIRLSEDIAIQPLYTRADLAGVPDLHSGPGEAPFLRGPRRRPAGRFWQIAQEISSSQSSEYNHALLDSLQRGQDAVVLLPTRASGGDGTTGSGAASGLRLKSLEDFSTALQAVDIRAVPVHLPTGSDPRALAALYLAFAHDRGVAFANLTGSVTSDPLGAAAATGRFPGSYRESLEAMAEWTKWASDQAPSLQTVGVDASLWAEGGATPTQELGIALACAAEYIRTLLRQGLSLDVTAQRIRFKFSIGSQFFVEIAKFRAFRPLWTRLLLGFGGSARLGATGALCAGTGRWNKTLLDPHVNMLRTTTEALSAVLGGVDCLNLAPFDEVTGKTTDFSRRIALNVHTLLAEEFGLASPADPAGGSWYVENLTNDLARAAWTQFQEIERRGGLAACLKSGYVQKIVEKSLAVKTSAIASRRLALVGTNLFPNLKEKPFAAPPPPPVKSNDSIYPFREQLAAPRDTKSEWNFITAIDAARGGGDANELLLRFRDTTPADSSIPAVKAARAAEGFEALRRDADAFAVRAGSRPKVFLAKMGLPIQHKARADFSAGFFSVGGFEVVASSRFDDVQTAAAAAVKSGAQIAVLCSTDETYPTLAPAFAQALDATGANLFVVLAGLPSDPALVASFREAGFDEFIHARANVQEMLASLLAKIGAAS